MVTVDAKVDGDSWLYLAGGEQQSADADAVTWEGGRQRGRQDKTWYSVVEWSRGKKTQEGETRTNKEGERSGE